MSISFEVLLVLGILSFYLYDSAILLYVDELVIAKPFAKWSFAIPSLNWRLAGKVLYLPNPLTPSTPLFRVTWSTDARPVTPHAVKELEALITSLRLLRRLVLFLLSLMLGALPVILLELGTGTWFLLTLALIYISIASMLIVVYVQHERLGLARRDLLSLVFESITCPPFALNMVRRISLRHAVRFSPIEFAHRYFEKQSFSSLVASLQTRLDAELELEDKGSHRSNELETYRARLAQLAS